MQDMPSNAPSSIHVLSLNLRFGLADDGPNRWEQRRAALAPLLSAWPCDFYGFQEANDFQIEFLAELLPDYGLIGRRFPAPPFWQNNILFFHRRWQNLASEHFFLSPTPDLPSRFRQSRWPRQCTLGIFRQGQRHLICVNTHFDFKTSIQTRSAELICQRLMGQASTWPAILMGDFNAGPQSPCYRVFTTIPSAGGPGFRNTQQPPYSGTHHGFSGKSQDEPIDWILYRGDLAASGAGVIQNRFAGYYPSDHFPLHAELAFL